jgi:hypothetical protein
MKFAIYLTKNKIFYSDKILDWDGVSLVEIFKNFKVDLGIKNFRIILGNDLGSVTFFETNEIDRNKIGAEMQTWLPYNLDNECFDYRTGVFNGSSVVQVVAVEKWLLEIVSLAVMENSLNLELMVPVGVLLSEKTVGSNNLVQVNWNGYENLSILAINGFAHSVFEFASDEKILNFAKTKWGAETNVEKLILGHDNFDLINQVFNEPERGRVEDVLNIPLLKKTDVVSKDLIKRGFEESKTLTKLNLESEEPVRKISKTTIVLSVFLILSLIIFMISTSFRNRELTTGTVPLNGGTTPTLTPTTIVIPEVDVSSYKVNVLNGSGVTGEAARVKELLLKLGFVTVDAGNAPTTFNTEIRKKEAVPSEVVAKASKTYEEYKVGSIGTLTATDKYDLVIVLGKDKVE